jgi:hypothetical protein
MIWSLLWHVGMLPLDEPPKPKPKPPQPQPQSYRADQLSLDWRRMRIEEEARRAEKRRRERR